MQLGGQKVALSGSATDCATDDKTLAKIGLQCSLVQILHLLWGSVLNQRIRKELSVMLEEQAISSTNGYTIIVLKAT